MMQYITNKSAIDFITGRRRYFDESVEITVKEMIEQELAIIPTVLANKYKVMDQLKLALVWNRIDVAKSEIFTDDKRWPTGILDDVMFSAILLNRIDFIKLFLEHGVSLKKFLTKERLLMLYNKIPPNCLLRTLLDRSKKDERKPGFSLRDVGTLIRDLMGDTFHPKALEVDYDLGDMDSKKGKQEWLLVNTNNK
ncbi:TRPCG-like protein [Mya arenaria]|uniref:TRPCG-like protein n=1 Tax=Mya arenaria TaxID=6604 RepID=A0ABY7ED68_MYAAR|nr:TRPCG-like protein [Mya arenaria]